MIEDHTHDFYLVELQFSSILVCDCGETIRSLADGEEE